MTTHGFQRRPRSLRPQAKRERLGTLSAPEQALWRAAACGEMADLRSGNPDEDDAARGNHWGPARSIRAEVLAAVLLGANPAEPGSVPVIRLAGARVTGTLQLTGADISRPLILDQCHFDEQPELGDARCRTMRMTDCHMPGLFAAGLQLSGSLVLERCVVRGWLALFTADISGELILSGTKVINPGDWTLFAGGLTVRGGLFCRRGFESHGTVNLAGAGLHGGCFFEFATFTQPGGKAFIAENATVDGPALFYDAVVNGDLRLPGAQLTGELSFARARIAGSGPLTLDCTRVHTPRLDLCTAGPVEGPVDLGHAVIGVVADDPASWPHDLRLDGASYESILAPAPILTAADRIPWLQRDPGGYRPQPYEELARWFRRLGHDDQARLVLFARLQSRRAGMSAAGKVWSYLLEWSIGYGYKPLRALLWLLLLVGIGTTVFGIDPPNADTTAQQQPFNSLVYTLNLLIPIGHIGQTDTWTVSGGLQWFAYSLVAAGWLMATAVISAITRIVSTS